MSIPTLIRGMNGCVTHSKIEVFHPEKFIYLVHRIIYVVNIVMPYNITFPIILKSICFSLTDFIYFAFFFFFFFGFWKILISILTTLNADITSIITCGSSLVKDVTATARFFRTKRVHIGHKLMSKQDSSMNIQFLK